MSDVGDIVVRHGGRELVFPAGQTVRIGRDPDADVVIESPFVSRQHLVLHPGSDGWRLQDSGSKRGSFHGRLPVVEMVVDRLMSVRLGSPDSGELVEIEPRLRKDVLPPIVHGEPRSVAVAQGPRLRIGRGQANDVILDDLQVSRSHAEVLLDRDGATVRDLDSRNGTFLNGERITEADLPLGAVIAVGRHLLRFLGDRLEEYVDDVGPTFESVKLTVMTGEGQKILDDVSFALPGGSFLAVVGPTGSGKSTLMKALTGFRPADSGAVYYSGMHLYDSYDQLRRRIGYVPQDDVLHPQLTIRRALEYAAELRFPSDASAAETRERVREVMEELGLSHRSEVAIEKLSGGQRKRVSVALELLTKPTLLFLDEPTSGLDPGFEKSVMQLLRELADGGRTVVVVTHSLQNLALCDYVLVLAPGGHTAYFGPPGEALSYFGQTDWADVFVALEKDRGTDWVTRFQRSPLYESHVSRPMSRPRSVSRPTVPASPPTPQRGWFSQVWTLTRRYVAVIAADRGYVRTLVIQAPLIGGMLLAILGSGLLEIDGQPKPKASVLAFGLVTSITFIGVTNAVREVVKELAIYRRERAIGMAISAYLASKVVVLAAFTALQAAVLVLVGIARHGGPSDGVLIEPGRLELVLVIALSGLVAMTLGLLVSTLVTNSDKAMGLVGVVIVAQMLLCGGVFRLPAGVRPVSAVISARWGYSATASTMDLGSLGACADGSRRGASRGLGALECEESWQHRRGPWTVDMTVLAGLGALGVLAAGASLKRRDSIR